MACKMTALEELLNEALLNDIDVKYANLPEKIKALYYKTKELPAHIAINKIFLENTLEEVCIMAEELGHHHTSDGDILLDNQFKTGNRKQELKARRWAVKKLISVERFIEAHYAGVSSRHELADYLNVTEEFLDMAIEHYKNIYGQCHDIGEYIIYFEPLGVLKKV